MEQKYIVAVGSSAGGLKPMLAFFDSIPNDHATSIILRHLQVNVKSILADILKRHAKLSVVEVENGMLIEKNNLYAATWKLYYNKERLFVPASPN